MLLPKTKNRKLQVAIIGDSSCSQQQEDLAYELGATLAKNDVTVICGGRDGIMRAVAKGAVENHGLTIGILPSADGNDANEFMKVVIPTGIGWTRNAFVPMASDGVIVVGGRTGTLSEMSFAWMWGKPIVSLIHEGIDEESWGFKLVDQGFDNRRSDKIYRANNPQEAVSKILELINSDDKSYLFDNKK